MAKAKKTTAATDIDTSISVDSAGNDNDNGSAVILRQAQDDKPKYDNKLHEAMKPYVDAYKEHKAFLVSSDGQVFLMTNEQDAKTHQKSLDPNKKLIKYSL